MRFTNAANYGAPPVPLRPRARVRATGSARLMGLRGLPGDLVLLLAYIILDGSYIGDESRLGIKIGPLPIFVTDVILIAVIAVSMRKHTGRLLNWAFGGGGAGAVGRAVWLLFVMALVYFALAFPVYRLNAMRDLAIFGYSLFFPLTYFALTRQIFAAKLVRYFIYAICIGALLFNFQLLSGIHLFKLVHVAKGLGGHGEVAHTGAGNLGNIGAALAGVFAYLVVERQYRGVHAGLLLLCLITLAQLMDRSAFLGFCLAGGVIFVLDAGRSRRYLTALAAVFLALLLVSSQGELPIPGGARLHGFWLAVSSGTNFQTDPDANFRLQRWHAAIQTWMTDPVFGVGFGAPILSDKWVRSELKVAARQDKLGSFNQGMPHNTFLMVLARTGPFGLGLICFAWIATLIRVLKGLKRRAIDPDQLAILAILLAMLPTAALNLFFERPMLCAPFWIMLAVGYKLSEGISAENAKTPLRTASDNAVGLRQPLNYPSSRRTAGTMVQVRRLWQE